MPVAKMTMFKPGKGCGKNDARGTAMKKGRPNTKQAPEEILAILQASCDSEDVLIEVDEDGRPLRYADEQIAKWEAEKGKGKFGNDPFKGKARGKGKFAKDPFQGKARGKGKFAKDPFKGKAGGKGKFVKGKSSSALVFLEVTNIEALLLGPRTCKARICRTTTQSLRMKALDLWMKKRRLGAVISSG